MISHGDSDKDQTSNRAIVFMMWCVHSAGEFHAFIEEESLQFQDSISLQTGAAVLL